MVFSNKINMYITNEGGACLYSKTPVFDELGLESIIVSGFLHGISGVFEELFRSPKVYMEVMDGDFKGNHLLIFKQEENTYIFMFDKSYSKHKAVSTSNLIVDHLDGKLKFEDSLDEFRKKVDSYLECLVEDLRYKYVKSLYEESILNTKGTNIQDILIKEYNNINKENCFVYFSRLKSLTQSYKRIKDLFEYAENYWPLFDEIFI